MKALLIGLVLHSLFACEPTPPGLNDSNQAQNDACNSPDAGVECYFINMPATLTNTMHITKPGETGEPLTISGRLLKNDGTTPYANVILYVYQTDDKGYYSKNGQERGVQKWHGRLHGWLKTDNDGYYQVNTIRPARYPDNSMPAHIHATVKTPSGDMYWINDFVFEDDALVNEQYLSSLTEVGGTGVVDVVKNSQGGWVGTRDVILK